MSKLEPNIKDTNPQSSLRVTSRIFSHFTFLLLLLCYTISCFGQVEIHDSHNVYYQKKVFKTQDKIITTTLIFDSLKIYGYVSGYDSLQFSEYYMVGKFKGFDDFLSANFIPIQQVDTVLINHNFAINTQIPDSSVFVNISFVLGGSSISGYYQLYNLFYSELLNIAKIQPEQDATTLCIYPYTRKRNDFFKILEISTTDEGRLLIIKTVIDCSQPHQPIVQSKSYCIVSSKRKQEKLQLKLEALNVIEPNNHCLSQSLPILILNSTNYIYYSLGCEEYSTYPKQPLQFALYLEQIAVNFK